ncbi:ABC transporter ATP-binding protein [Mycoplasmopsis gallopavonis]|uniref:ABC transporter ATP-binding protein n=1 Tax=Mycoplasmopsis gallopavonis TaxID=76629 RepID=A0A449B030_9BACT|nr:ABC transporter ATP-binding protein [Mycoplasmopsis gallopavonis]RIV16384.1 ABC transporter ATP-binding protein [Mycoplasmopsis gallopavonis]VEU73113.1 ABC transporter ATP-binding protein [Mycoplasmopsis gallopavonis]
MQKILEVKNLNKIYKSKDRVSGIFDLNFSVEKGSFHAFIGENGAGKTTTIKSIVGAYCNYDGEILIGGIANTKPESKKLLGYVPENAIFPKDLTTFDYLFALACLNGLNKKEAETKIDQLLAKFEISDLKNQKPYNFSSGQKKKILLIQALMFEPEILILDEPAANLDPTARYNLFKLLQELNKEGKTIFISSHVLSEIDKYTNSLTLIHQGQIVYSGIKNKDLESIFYEKVIKK